MLSLTGLKSLPSRIGDLGLRLLVSADSRTILAALPRNLVSRLVHSLSVSDLPMRAQIEIN